VYQLLSAISTSFTAIHFLFAFGHLVGEFSCCFKNSGCDILTAGWPRDDAILRNPTAAPASRARRLRVPPDLQRTPLCLDTIFCKKNKCSNKLFWHYIIWKDLFTTFPLIPNSTYLSFFNPMQLKCLYLNIYDIFLF
jgi:hypothetical protein